MIAYTPNGPDFFPRAALSEAAGQEVYLAHEDGAFVVVPPPGVDWADYYPQPDIVTPQPDLEVPQPPIEIPQPDIDGVPQPSIFEPQPPITLAQPDLVTPQPDLRIPRDPWAYYSSDPQPTPEWVAAWRPVDNTPPPAPVSEFEMQRRELRQQYLQRREARQANIDGLMVDVSVAMVASGRFSRDSVDYEGSKFVAFHGSFIYRYVVGGNSTADDLYKSIASAESKAAFPWLGDAILAIFAAALGVAS